MNRSMLAGLRARASEVRAWLLGAVCSAVLIPAGVSQAVTITANDSAAFTSALSTANLGDTIVLNVTTTYIGSFTLPNKTTGSGYITIQSSALGSLPAAGTRVFPTHAGSMPNIQSAGANAPAIKTAAGAHHYKLIGLEIIAPSNNSDVTSAVLMLGDGSSAQNSTTQIPHNIIIDRCIFRSNTTSQNCKRVISIHSASTDITNCHITGAHFVGIESQCIGGWNGPGPYNIINNYLEGAGEHIMFGGATVYVPNNVPSDILVTKNHFFIPPSWFNGTPDWAIKNHFELKSGKRVTIEGNIFENCWHDAGNQNGASLVFKTIQSSDQGASWIVTEDIIVRKNIIKNVGLGIVIAGSVSPTGGSLNGQPARVTVTDNIFQNINTDVTGNRGWWISMGSASPDVTFDHNTAFHTSSIAGIWGAQFPRFVFKNNLTNQAGYGWKGDGQGDGETTLAAYFPGVVWQKNVIQGGNSNNYLPNYPSGFASETTAFPSTWSGVLVNQASPGTNYAGWKVVNGSLWDNTGTDGKDIGADIDAVVAATAGCVSGVWSSPQITKVLKNGVNGYTGALSMHLNGQSPTTYYGPSTYQHVLNNWPGSGGYVMRPFYKFDLTQGANAIPAGATIDSATLRVPVTYSSSSTDRSVRIHRVAPVGGAFTVNYATATKNTYNGTNTWTGGTNAGGDVANTNNDFLDTPDSTATLPTAGTTGNLVFDVKSSVQAWVNGSSNQGWLMITGSTTALTVYLGATSDLNGSVDYPELTITYH